MIYNLKNNNYKTFEAYKDNIIQPRSYFIPFSCVEAMDGTDIRNERYSSDMVECLSGEWDFIYYSDCTEIPDSFNTEAIDFDKISVPSTWQHTGYEKPYYLNTRYQFKPNPPEIPEDCSAGIYRRFFNVDDTSLNYVISFLGVAGALDVFVNGSYVGYSEGSHNTSQLELDEFIVEGSNELVVVVHRWSNGTYLECQDMFRCNGIFRDVLLYKTGSNSVYDFEVKTTRQTGNGTEYSLNIIPSLKLTEECVLTAFLYDDGELVASKSVNQSPGETAPVDMGTLRVHEWNAECPYLYDLLLVLTMGDEQLEVIRRPIGFKTIEIEGNVFYFNNKPIKLLGVNHHDTNPKTGYVLTIEEMEQDVSLVKQYNGNCIRTSHYPPDPSFLDLCDEYGIYVVDEADIETHGIQSEYHHPGALSHNPEWQGHYWDRVYRMYERDKNHPSITMWSLGNESHGYKNHDYCYAGLKRLSPIPIHYEGVCRTRRWAYDVISQMYPWPGRFDKIAAGRGLPRKYYTKPYYMCEFAHAMGVGAGELERYVLDIYSAKNLMGGCIWEFADHAVYHEDGQHGYTYGGDHGEYKHDGNFCVDGLFYPDRAPHSGALQMKACFRPIRASKLDDSSYSLFNHRYFEAAALTVNYKLLTDGEPVITGSRDITIQPQKSEVLRLDGISLDRHRHNIIQLEYTENDFIIAAEELVLSEGELPFIKPEAAAPSVKESEKRLFISFDNGEMIFNRKTGNIDSYIYKGRELINQLPSTDFKGFGLQLYRAPLDNDMYIRLAWNKCRLESAASFVRGFGYKISGDCLEITQSIRLKTPVKLQAADVSVKYSIYGDGTIRLDYRVNSGGGIKLIPRFGVQLEMPLDFNRVTYYGLGPYVNLPDFKAHTLTGIYSSDIWDMHEDYIKPQESATRCNTRMARLTDDNGIGFEFSAVDKPFVFSANPYTPQQCARAMHREDLRVLTSCVNIDSEVMGAGSNSCGPIPSRQYRLGALSGKTLSFTVKPIG